MNWSRFVRQGHRWVSIFFVLLISGLLLSQGLGHEPPEWAFFTPLLPLLLLILSGLYLFALPHTARWSARRKA